MNDTGPDSTSTGLLQTLLFDNEAGADEEARRESEAQSLYVVGGHALAPARRTRRSRHAARTKTLTLGAECEILPREMEKKMKNLSDDGEDTGCHKGSLPLDPKCFAIDCDCICI